MLSIKPTMLSTFDVSFCGWFILGMRNENVRSIGNNKRRDL